MEVSSKLKLETSLHLELSEAEGRVLYAIVAYGYDAFMKVFKEKLGSAYLETLDKPARELFNTLYAELPKHFKRFDSVLTKMAEQ